MASEDFNIVEKEKEMKRLAALSATLTLAYPALALAEEHSGGYRGIGMLYYIFMAAILIYGVNDAFGKKAMYVAAPIIIIGFYLLLPAN
jgi:hypothetical protein